MQRFLGKLLKVYLVLMTTTFACSNAEATARDQWGTEFLIFQAHEQKRDESCAIEVQVVTDYYEGAEVNLVTPRLGAADGGFRQSSRLQRHIPGTFCVKAPKRGFKPGRSDNVILLQADQDVSVMIVTTSPSTETELRVVYPIDVMGANYHFNAHKKSALIVIATDADTEIAISNYAYLEGSQKTESIYNVEKSLQRYEAFIIKRDACKEMGLCSGLMVNTSKPVVVLAETDHPYPDSSDRSISANGESASQQIPTVNWNTEFYFGLPVNKKVVDLHLKITVELKTKKATVLLSHPTENMKNLTIQAPKRTLMTKLEAVPEGKSRVIWCRVTKPASAVLLIQTYYAGLMGFAVTNIPPAVQFYNLYIWSIKGDGMTYVLHVITFWVYKAGLTLKHHNGTSLALKDTRTGEIFRGGSYISLTRVLDTSGTYILTNTIRGVVFGAFLEKYDPDSHHSALTELGMRFAPLNKNCTETKMTPGDTLDNDCNGSVDEDPTEDSDTDSDRVYGEDVAPPLPQSGGLGNWQEWTCSGSCVSGVLARSRYCTNPPPSRGGLGCIRKTSSDGVSCLKSKTECLQDCSDGSWGLECSAECPPNCVSGTCNRLTGECNSGCKSGFYGPHCKIACHSGYGGLNCSIRCSTICPSRECDSITLKCKERGTSLVTLGMAVTCLVIFMGCPAVGCLFYCITLPGEAPLPDLKQHLITTVQLEHLDVDIDDEEGDIDDEDEMDEDEESSSSSSSKGSIRSAAVDSLKDVEHEADIQKASVDRGKGRFMSTSTSIMRMSSLSRRTDTGV